ncbi:MAG: SDR family oxidoreductase [Chloroflexi bacterium]|nr:SDR family oxidoreductase [Chloroflexota bacterium]
MKALVTGGAGFIGSHLCQRLMEDGHEVICVDNLITGNRENVAHLLDSPHFQFVERDVTQQLDLQADLIFHLASPASPPGYLLFPVHTSLANSLGTYNLLELARRWDAKFLLTSTSETYGDPLEHPQREDYWGNVNPIGMRSCYDESKRFAESLTMTYKRHHNLDARIVRIFNTYGPHSDPNDGRMVPNFVTQALRGEPITVFGQGQQTRSLCYVADLVEGIVRAMFRDGTRGEVFNLGMPDEHTVLEFAQIIKRLVPSDSPIEFRPPISEDDPSRRCPDISKARDRLNWEPKVGLDEGLRLTIEWFRQKLNSHG